MEVVYDKTKASYNMQHIDHIFYINLAKRVDRYEQINEEFRKMNIPSDKYERFDAFAVPELPTLGCNRSHLGAMKLAKQRGYKNVLIFEDDFEFLVNAEELQDQLEKFFERARADTMDWKVAMLSYNSFAQQPYDELLSITTDCQTASGYLINGKYLDELIHWMQIGTDRLEQTKMFAYFMNDQWWKHLQKDNKWFLFNKRLGRQRESYSDLCGGMVNYQV